MSKIKREEFVQLTALDVLEFLRAGDLNLDGVTGARLTIRHNRTRKRFEMELTVSGPAGSPGISMTKNLKASRVLKRFRESD